MEEVFEGLAQELAETKAKLEAAEKDLKVANDANDAANLAHQRVVVEMLLRHRATLLDERLVLRKTMPDVNTGLGPSRVTAGVDSSADFSAKLVQPLLEAPPALDNLHTFLTTPPGAQIPIIAEVLSSLGLRPELQRCFVAASGTLANTVAVSLMAPLTFGPSEMWTTYAEHIVVVMLLLQLDAVLPADLRIGLVAERDQQDSTSLLTVKSQGGTSLRPDGVLRDGAGLRMLAKWENNISSLQQAAIDLQKKTAFWTPLYYGDIEYLPCFAAAGSQLQFYAISRVAGMTQMPRPVSAALQLTNTNDRAQAVVTAIKFYQLLRAQQSRYPQDVLSAGAELCAVHPCGFKRALFFRTDELTVRKRVAPWSKFTTWSGVDFECLRELYTATQRCAGVVHALAGAPTLTDEQYSVDLVPVGFTPVGAKPTTEDEARNMVHGLLHGLAAIHKAGFVHRDLRLDNTACSPIGRRWFLLDLETCAPKDERPAAAFNPAGWPPGGPLVDGLYTAASDLFQLGRMVFGPYGSVVSSVEGKAFLDVILTTSPAALTLSAEQLLTHAWLQCPGDTCRAAGAQPGER